MNPATLWSFTPFGGSFFLSWVRWVEGISSDAVSKSGLLNWTSFFMYIYFGPAVNSDAPLFRHFITNRCQPFIHMEPENAHLKKEKHGRPKPYIHQSDLLFAWENALPLVSKAQKSSNLGASIGLAFRNEHRSEANNCFNHGWSTVIMV